MKHSKCIVIACQAGSVARLVCGSFVLCQVHGFHKYNASARHPLEERKGHIQFLTDFIRNTNIIRPRPIQRKKKSPGPQQKQCSLCKQPFKQKDLQSKTFVEGTKKKTKIILALGNLCDAQNQSCCLPEHTIHQLWPSPSSQGHKCWLLPLARTHHSRPQGASAVQRSWTQSHKGSAPENKPV